MFLIPVNLQIFDTHTFFKTDWNWTTESNINEGAFGRRKCELNDGAIIWYHSLGTLAKNGFDSSISDETHTHKIPEQI